MQTDSIQYLKADHTSLEQIEKEWSLMAAKHLVIDNGFSIIAMAGEKPIGIIGLYWSKLPTPLENTREAYINIIEVLPDFRGQGIAREMISRSIELCREEGVYQVRAWSSDDKVEALPMWQRLGFALCPADNPWHAGLKGFFVGYVL